MPDPLPSSSQPSGPRLSIPNRTAPTRWERIGVRARSWWRNYFSRDRVMNGLRSLPWVVPLTLLIWVYAEREQVVPVSVAIPIDVVSSDPNRIVTIEGPGRPANGRPQVMATLSGPKAQTEAVKDRLIDGSSGSAVRIEVGPSVGEGQQRIDVSRIGNDPRFVSKGVTVSAPQPQFIEVYVDPIVERDVPVKGPADFAPVFEPAKVKVRGPKRVLIDAEQRGSLFVNAQLNGRPELTSAQQSSVQLQNVGLTVPFGGGAVALADRQSVTARVEIARPQDHTFPFLPVLAASPPGLTDSFRVTYEPTVKNVIITGPKDKVDEFTKAGVPPRAVFEIPPDQTAGSHSAKLRIELPTGLSVKESAPLTIDYQLTPRSVNP